MADDLIPHSQSGYDTSSGPLGDPMYLSGHHQDASRSHASHSHSHSHHYHHHPSSSLRHTREQDDMGDPRKWSRAL